MASAEIIAFPLSRRLGRPALTAEDLKIVEAFYDAQEAGSAWRGFAAIGGAVVVLFTSYDRSPSLTLRRDTAGAYELAAADGTMLRRARTIEQILSLFARAVRVG
jgi:hypothetical protein